MTTRSESGSRFAIKVLDRFHIANKLGEAIDAVRRHDTKQLASSSYQPIFRSSRCCFFKRKSNLTIS